MLIGDERQWRRVGAVTLGVLALAVVFAVVIAPRIEWRETIRVRVAMGNSGGLREGAPLVVAGRAIGVIESIGFREGGVEVVVAIEAAAAAGVPGGGEVFVASRGPFSARYLELAPAPDPDGAPLRDGDVLVGRDPPSLDRVLQRTWENLSIAREFGAAVTPEASLLAARLTELAATLDTLAPSATSSLELKLELLALLAEAQQLYADGLGGADGIARLGAVLARGGRTVALFRRVLAELGVAADALRGNLAAARAQLAERGPAAVAQLERALAQVDAVIAGLDPLLAQVEALRDRLARGEGSLGRLMTDPEFPEDAKELGKIMKRQPWKILQKPAADVVN